MNKLLLVLTLVLIALPQTGQAGWWRTYGGDVGNCVQLTSDGNYIVAGNKGDSLCLLKLDTIGQIIWSKTYKGSANWVEETPDSGFIVCGSPNLLKTNSEGDSIWAKNYGLTTRCVQVVGDDGYVIVGGNSKLVIIRTNLSGDTLWTQKHGDTTRTTNAGYFIQRTNDKGFIVTGATRIETSEFATGYLWLVKTDSLGHTEWSKEFGSGTLAEFNQGYCVREIDDGYVISGVTTGLIPNGLWLLKTNIQGDTVWTKIYNMSNGGTGFSIQSTHDGGYIVAGATENYLASSNLGTTKLWLLRTNANGDTIWTRLYDANNWAVGRCAQQTNDSGYIVLGRSSLGIYLLKTDSLGSLAIEEFPSQPSLSDWKITNTIGNQITLHYSDRSLGIKAYIFDVTGSQVDIIEGRETSGILTWGSNFPPGVYFIRPLDIRNQLKTSKVVLVR